MTTFPSIASPLAGAVRQRIALRDYQQQGKDDILAAWVAGHQNVLAVFPTGAGKGVLLAEMVAHHGKGAVVIAHRQELVAQLAESLNNAGVRFRLVCPKATRQQIIARLLKRCSGPLMYDANALVGLGGVDTVINADKKPEHASWMSACTLWVCDECFPAGTMVGGRPIETLQVGDLVPAFNEQTGQIEQRAVTRLFKSIMPSHMMRLRFGRHVLECTAGHPIWTRRGWQPAAHVTDEDEVLSDQESSTGQLLGVHKGVSDRELAARSAEESRPMLLLEGVRLCLSGSDQLRDNGQDQPQVRIRPNDRAQSNASRGSARQGIKKAQGDRPSAEDSRRQWSRGYSAGAILEPHVRRPGLRAATEHPHRDGPSLRLSDRLQAGSGELVLEDSVGSRRVESLCPGAPGARPQEGCVLDWARVDSIEIFESTNSRSARAGVCDGHVYNIEVEGLHTYVADGVVVHNCHHVTAENKWGRALAKFQAPGIHGLGLTATPARTDGQGLGRHADGIFDFMIQGPSPRHLIDQGFLSPFRIWTVPCHVQYDQLPVGASGDFVQAKLVAAEEADDQLVGDIVSTYAKRAPGKRAVVFLSSVKKAEEVAQRFNEAGFKAVAVDGKTPDDLRAKAFDDLESGETLILCNCALVDEGLDIPAVEVVILGTATNSFIRFSQWVGRGLRLMLSPEEKAGFNEKTPAERARIIAGSVKPYAIVLDHGGNILRHNGPPDMARQYTLDRREGRGSGSGEVAPYRICANKGYSEPRGGWEKWRSAGWTVKQMEEHGHISLGTDAIPCAQPYERIHKACPYCGFMPDPQSRRDIEHVEGDLQELDEETLNAIRSQVAEANRTVDEYREYMAGTKVNGLAQMANVKRHAERLAELEELRQIMGHWGGYWRLQGDNDSQLQRRFFHYYGIDVLSAQALKRQEAETLKWRILTSLSRLGIVGLPTTAGEQR